jgi:LPS export ABC transporter protein LptC
MCEFLLYFQVMKKASQYVLSLLFLLLIAEMVVFSPSELRDKKVDSLTDLQMDKKVEGASADIEQAMHAVHVIETKNESKEWELWADAAVGFRDQDNLELKKVKAKFFSDDGMTFDVTGEKGEVLTEKKNMLVDGGVITHSSTGYTFRTTKIEYDSEGRHLKSQTPVEVVGPRDRTGRSFYISGREMSAQLALGIVLIENDVKAKKTIQDDKSMSVTSQRVQLVGNDKSIKFSGQVVIDIDGMRITGPDAIFRYDSASDAIQTIELDGGVKVSDMNKWATSDKLNIDLLKNEYVFDGQPRVVQDNDELRGDRITFLNGGRKVKVQNAKIKVSQDTLDTNRGALKK